MANIAENVISKFNGKSIMEGVDKNQFKEFTHRFFGLVALSGRKIEENYKNIRIDAYPYINNKETKEKLAAKYAEYATTEDIILYFKASENQELYISDNGIYFDMLDVIEEEHKIGFVPFDNISSLNIIQKGDYFCLYCNDVLLITDDVKSKDFYEDIDLKEYLEHINKNSLTISQDEMVDGVKRHTDTVIYNSIKQKVRKSNILNIIFEYDDDEHVIVVIPGSFCAYRIDSGCANKNGNFESFAETNFTTCTYGDELVYLYGNSYYSLKQLDAVISYMNELDDERRKEEAIEADIQKQVEKLVKLKTIGLITDEEFDEKRKVLLERMGI